MEKLKRQMEEAAAEGAELEAADEFYENLEAPKFVDLTAPDPRRSDDDRFWFCSRVGCDQKHEEELDSETIYKNFVLRVMSARSPNIRQRKGLNGKAPSASLKCPLSAPAKPSKPKVSRLALISSISRKLGDGRLKTRLSPKLNSTPKRVIPVASKFMTTPRNKGCIANKDNFRSVQNPKARSNLNLEARVVAKALVFQSPKKVLRKKHSVESESTPMRKICEGMENMENESQKKRILGYSSKPTKDNRHKLKEPLCLDGSNRSEWKVQVCGGIMMLFAKLKDQKDKSSGLTKEEYKKDSKTRCGSIHQDQIQNLSTGMNSKEKSGNDSLKVESGSSADEANRDEEPLRTTESLANSSFADPSTEEVDPTSKLSEAQSFDISAGYENSQPKADEIGSAEYDLKVEVSEGKEEERLEGLRHAEIIKSTAEKVSEDLATPHCQPSGAAILGIHHGEVLDNDNKENESAPDSNRTMKLKADARSTAKKMCYKNQKVDRTVNKNLKDAVAVAATGIPGLKYKKPKPTNPKPFRLRTDERGILKEANLEKRRHLAVPVNETMTISRPRTLNSQTRRVENSTTSKEGDSDESGEAETCNKSMKGVSVPEERRKRMLKDQLPPNEDQKSELASKSNRNDSIVQRKTKPMSDQRQVLRTNKAASTTKKMVSCMKTSRLNVIKETASKLSKCHEVGGEYCGTWPLLKGRRPNTIPKDPNFHSTHKPRSCTLNVA